MRALGLSFSFGDQKLQRGFISVNCQVGCYNEHLLYISKFALHEKLEYSSAAFIHASLLTLLDLYLSRLQVVVGKILDTLNLQLMGAFIL